MSARIFRESAELPTSFIKLERSPSISLRIESKPSMSSEKPTQSSRISPPHDSTPTTSSEKPPISPRISIQNDSKPPIASGKPSQSRISLPSDSTPSTSSEKPPKSARMSMTLPRTASITITPKKDWREDKTMAQRNLYMLEHQLKCDIVFEFPPVSSMMRNKKIRAHSFMLRSASSVFEELMELSPRALEPIQIKSVDPTTFWLLLHYIYTEEAELTIDNVSPLLLAANKYKIYGLRMLCLGFLENNITEDTVCVILEEALQQNQEELIQKCLRYIDKDTSDVLKSSGFLHLSRDSLERILSRDELIIREEEIYNALLEWSRARCRSESLLPTGKNCRRVIGKLFFLIRFPLMNPQFYTNKIANSDLLSDEEKVDLFRFFFGSPKPELPFPEKPRQWNKRASGILFIKPYPDIFSQGNMGSNMF